MKQKLSAKKLLSIIANVILYIFIVISIVGVILTISAKKGEDGTATIFGMQMRYVLSPSMEKSEYTNTDDFDIKDIPAKSIIFVSTVPDDKAEAYEWYDALEVGDVLTFRYVYASQETITHRITSIEDNGSKTGFIIKLEGDNKSSETGALTQVIDTAAQNSPNYVIGKVVGKSIVLGFLVSILTHAIGIIAVVIVPCTAILTFEVAKIVRILTKDKRKKEEEEKAERENELEALKLKLAELEAKANKTEAVEQSTQNAPSDSHDNIESK